MAELSLYRLNTQLNSTTVDLQAQINTKQNIIVEDATHRWFTDAERTKLQSVQAYAEVNQNAFSYITIGSSTISATNKTGTFELAKGSNIDLAVSGNKVTVALLGQVPSAALADLATQATNADTVDGKHASAFALDGHNHDNTTLVNIDWTKILNKPTTYIAGGGDADTVDGKHANAFANASHTHDDLTLSSISWAKILNKPVGYPADGGNADTLDGYNATDFSFKNHIHDNTTLTSIDWSKITNKPTTYIAGGGDADTVDGKHYSDISALIDNKISNAQATTNTTITTAQTAAQTYADTHDFLPFNPKIYTMSGNTVPLFAKYNMSYTNYDSLEGTATITDSSEREILYFIGSDGVSNEQLYRAYRYSSLQTFSFDNNPIRPAFLLSTEYIQRIIGLGTNYIAVHVVGSGYSKQFLIVHGGNSDYTQWTNYKEITSLCTSSPTVVYDDTYNSFTVINYVSRQMIMKLYNYSNLTQKGSNILYFDEAGILDLTGNGITAINSISLRMPPTSYYNYATKEFVLIYGLIIYFNNSSGTSYNSRTLTISYSMPPTFFSNGTDTITPVIPLTNSNYSYFTPGLGVSVAGSYDQTHVFAYDKQFDAVYWGHKSFQSNYLTTTKLKSLSITSWNNLINNQVYNQYNNIPDASPWSKQIFRDGLFINDMIYFKGISNKFGTNWIGSNFYTNQFDTVSSVGDSLKLVPGSWWLSSSVESSSDSTLMNNSANYCCVKLPDGTTTYYISSGPNNKVYKVQVADFTINNITYHGKRTLVDTGITIPALPSGYSYLGRWAYDPTNNIFYAIVLPSSQSPSRLGFASLLKYSSGAWTEYTDLGSAWDAPAQQSYNALGQGRANWNGYCTSTLVTPSFNVYLSTSYSTPGGSTNIYLYKLPLNATSVTNIKTCTPWWGTAILGWSDIFGYYFCSDNAGNRYNLYQFSKDPTGFGAEFNEDDFFTNNRYYSKYLYVRSSIGLVAYVSNINIFLGGYSSNLDTQEIPLNPNCVNYIYLSRNKDNRDKVDIQVSKTKLNNQFGKVLVSEVTTDAQSVISQLDYPIGIEYGKYRVTLTLATGANKVIDVKTAFGPNVNPRDTVVRIGVKDTSSSSPTYNMYVDDKTQYKIAMDDNSIKVINTGSTSNEYDILVHY